MHLNNSKNYNKTSGLVIAAVFCVTILLFWCFLLTKKFYSFGYYDWDLAFFTQAAWNLLHGEPFVSLAGINYFGDHSYFFTFLTLPIFYFAPSPLTLIYLKVFSFAISGFLLYRIAKDELGDRAGLYILMLYFLFPGNIFGLLYEFNPEAFAPPFILLSWRAAQKGRFYQFLIWTILLASIKENMCLLAIMLSLYGFIKSQKKYRVAWIILTAVYSGIFFFLILKLIPLLRNLPQHAFMVRYSNLGQNTTDLLLSPILHSKEFFKAIFNPMNHSYALSLFDYLLIPVLLSFEKLLPAAPLLLQHFISTHYPEHTIFYHYVPTISPFIFIAFIGTLKKINCLVISRWSNMIFNGFFILAIFSLFSYAELLRERLNITSMEQAAHRWQLLNQIPPDAGVIATFDYLAPLSTRAQLYSFHKIYDDAFQEPGQIKRSELNTHTVFTLPENIRYAIIDLDDGWLINSIAGGRQKVLRRVVHFLNDSQWKLAGRTGRTILLFR